VLLAINPPAASGYTFTASWQSPGGQIVPVTGALYQLCPTSGIGNCTTPSPAPVEGPASITAPSEGIWTLEVWYTNAAGLGGPNNASTITFSAPATSSNPGTTSGGSSGGGSSSGGEPGSNSGPPPSNGPDKNANSPPLPRPSALHVQAHVRDRRLLVQLAGTANTTVKLSYTARSHTKTTAHARTTVTLDEHGEHTTSFPLPVRWATIQIAAQPTNSQTVTRTTLHQTQRPAPAACSKRAVAAARSCLRAPLSQGLASK
jgi:hypothetical protein